MPPQIGSGMVSGIYDFWVGRRSQAGMMMGSLRDTENPVPGTLYAAYRSRALISFAGGTPTYELAQERGGQSLGPQRDLGVTAWGNPTITLSRYDERLDGIINDYDPDTTFLGESIITARNSARSNTVPLVVGIVVGFDSENDVENYLTIIYPNAAMRPAKPSSSQSGGTNPNPLAYSLLLSPSENMGIGSNFKDTALDIVDVKDTDYIVRGRYPYYPLTYVSDGLATGFVAPYLPISSIVTGATINMIRKNMLPGIWTSFSTTTGAVVLTPGVTGDKWQGFYQTKFILP